MEKTHLCSECNKTAELIGVTEGGGIKYHCPSCYKITIVNDNKKR
jgi:predicted RNA-binding Zn-ribbon protein involved in translation (DUF1610 family)